MADEQYSLEQLNSWTVQNLRIFCSSYGLAPSNKSKQELVAVTYSATVMKLPKVRTSEEVVRANEMEYNSLLRINNIILPDPLSSTDLEWVGEDRGIQEWPPLNIGDITMFFNDGSYGVGKRLLSDYKAGKAYEYFASNWLKEVQTATHAGVILLKAECTPSMKVKSSNHKIWICLGSTGEILRAYCTCTAGLDQSCNHIAAILFRVEHAVKEGLTACTSLPCSWQVPSQSTIVKPMRLKDMEFMKARHGKTVNRRMGLSKKYKAASNGGCTSSSEWYDLLSKVDNKSSFVKMHFKPDIDSNDI